MKAAFAVGLFLLLGIAAHATPTTLSLDDCDDDAGCQGSDLFLSVDETSDGVFHVVLTLDSTGYTGSRLGVNQAGFKAIGDVTLVSLLSAPNAGWSDPVIAPINSNGDVCDDESGSSNHICTAGFTDITANGLYTWEFEVVGGEILGDWHIGFQYANSASPAKGQIISASGEANGPPIPEPSAALVFMTALAVVAPRLRRR